MTDFTRTFSLFVDDLGGFLWSYKASTGRTWEQIAKDTNCCTSTISNLANRATRNPTLYTCWKILRALDNRQIIRHSMLEGYRKYSKTSIRVIREAA